MTTRPPEPPSIACTLAGGDLDQRLEWIADLNRASLRDRHRDGLRLELTYAPEALDEVSEVVRREQECCAFLTFDLRHGTDAVRLVIEVPEAARDAAETVLAPFSDTGAMPVGSAPHRAAPPPAPPRRGSTR